MSPPHWGVGGAAPDLAAAPGAHAGMQRSASAADHRQRRHGGERYATLELSPPGQAGGHLPIVPERGADSSESLGESMERASAGPGLAPRAPVSGAAGSSAMPRSQSGDSS